MRVNAQGINIIGTSPWMDTPAERLLWARKRAGFNRATEAARSLAVPEQTYLAHENGSRGIRSAAGALYARRYRVNFNWLMTGDGKPSDRERVPIVSYVGAGAEVYPVDDNAQISGLDAVDAPTGGTDGDCVAARVRGESMYPMLRDGWLIFWRRDVHGVASDCINQLCIVKLAGDGPTLVKWLRQGPKPGLFNLESHNAPLRESVRLEWAAKVIDIRPN